MKRFFIILFFILSVAPGFCQVRDQGLGRIKTVSFYAVASSSTPMAAYGVATYTSVIVDTNSAYDGLASYTIPLAGRYRVEWVVAYSQSSGSAVNATSELWKNGAQIGQSGTIAVANATVAALGGNIEVDLSAGDILSVKLYTSSTTGNKYGTSYTIGYFKVEKMIVR